MWWEILLPTTREGNVFRSVCQSFCPQGEGCLPCWQRPSQRETLRQRLPWTETPQTETPLDRDPLDRDPSQWTETPPNGQRPLPMDRDPHGQRFPDRGPLDIGPRWPLQQSVRILLECIFVSRRCCQFLSFLLIVCIYLALHKKRRKCVHTCTAIQFSLNYTNFAMLAIKAYCAYVTKRKVVTSTSWDWTLNLL